MEVPSAATTYVSVWQISNPAETALREQAAQTKLRSSRCCHVDRGASIVRVEGGRIDVLPWSVHRKIRRSCGGDAHHARDLAIGHVEISDMIEVECTVSRGDHGQHALGVGVVEHLVDQADKSPVSGFDKPTAETHVGDVSIDIRGVQNTAEDGPEGTAGRRAFALGIPLQSQHLYRDEPDPRGHARGSHRVARDRRSNVSSMIVKIVGGPEEEARRNACWVVELKLDSP